MDQYFDMRKPNGELIEGVHELAVKDHERLGYKIVVDGKVSDGKDPEQDAAEVAFENALRFAREKHTSSQAKAFKTLEVTISDDVPINSLINNTLDALANLDNAERRDGLILLLFGKSADLAREQVDARRQVE